MNCYVDLSGFAPAGSYCFGTIHSVWSHKGARSIGPVSPARRMQSFQFFVTGDASETAAAGGTLSPNHTSSDPAIFWSNFHSNTWRVHSEANAHDALLRASGSFAGRVAANAFEEFWPDIKKRIFRKRN